MALVKYVGVKPEAVDMWYGSGRIWNGKDDVQEVTDQQARRLCAHAGEFELVPEKPGKAKKEKAVAPKADDPKFMSTDELREHAQEKFGETLPASLTRQEAISEVEHLEAGSEKYVRGVKVGSNGDSL